MSCAAATSNARFSATTTIAGEAVARIKAAGKDVDATFAKLQEQLANGYSRCDPMPFHVIQIYTDKAGTASQAAGAAAHDTKHWLQKITPSTYRQFHEFEAYQFQRQAGYLSLTNEQIQNLIDMSPLYKNVPK